MTDVIKSLDVSRADGAQMPLAQTGVRLRDGWYVTRIAGSYTLSRHLPARFDLCASTRLPRVKASRLARQIRQDLWRELQGLRGFSPVVEVSQDGDSVCVRAGGRLMSGPATRSAVQRIEVLLNDPARRARWCTWARVGGQG
ncbi:MAG: hypothetical protein ACKVKF_06725 [Rhodobacterales bacterium]|uniref:hypothetical protein n=1 Tax=Puniceibacterium antarcticum TaxID=1206336 RepID=UPI001FE70EEA|nr:hypothetical protein [Puniceibacterium antarcticum]